MNFEAINYVGGGFSQADPLPLEADPLPLEVGRRVWHSCTHSKILA